MNWKAMLGIKEKYKSTAKTELIKGIFEDMKVSVEITATNDENECFLCRATASGVTIWIEESYEGVKRQSKFFACDQCLTRWPQLSKQESENMMFI